jgi:hypothetical protein
LRESGTWFKYVRNPFCPSNVKGWIWRPVICYWCRVYSYSIQPVQLFGLGNVGDFVELGFELGCDGFGDEWTDFLETVILLSHILEEFGGLLAFTTRQSQFYLEEAVES